MHWVAPFYTTVTPLVMWYDSSLLSKVLSKIIMQKNESRVFSVFHPTKTLTILYTLYMILEISLSFSVIHLSWANAVWYDEIIDRGAFSSFAVKT